MWYPNSCVILSGLSLAVGRSACSVGRSAGVYAGQCSPPTSAVASGSRAKLSAVEGGPALLTGRCVLVAADSPDYLLTRRSLLPGNRIACHLTNRRLHGRTCPGRVSRWRVWIEDRWARRQHRWRTRLCRASHGQRPGAVTGSFHVDGESDAVVPVRPMSVAWLAGGERWP